MPVTKRVSANDFRCYGELAQRYQEGVDYAVHVMPRGRSRVAVVAPHGGRFEGRTSEIARLMAGDENGLYLFEGVRTTGHNFDWLQPASTLFDGPRTPDLIAGCDTGVAG